MYKIKLKTFLTSLILYQYAWPQMFFLEIGKRKKNETDNLWKLLSKFHGFLHLKYTEASSFKHNPV